MIVELNLEGLGISMHGQLAYNCVKCNGDQGPQQIRNVRSSKDKLDGNEQKNNEEAQSQRIDSGISMFYMIKRSPITLKEHSSLRQYWALWEILRRT